MPLGHVSLATGPTHYKAMRDFYVAILAPLGYQIFMEKEGQVIGFGPKNGSPDFWLHCGGVEMDEFDGDTEKKRGKTHVAFTAGGPKAIDEWYKIAVKAGGFSNGVPGERPQYVKGYYAAFVLDPLGNNIEVMHWSPLWLKALMSIPYVATAILGAGVAIGAAKFAM